MGRFMVPFGTNPEEYEFTKGVVIVYNTFDGNINELIQKAIQTAEDRKFDKVLLYPLHEKTSKRMDIEILLGYKQRVKEIENALLDVLSDVQVEICKLEGKRSKYTPIDFTLSFISEHHKGPYFLLMPDYIANKFASYSSFDKWIREVRLMIFKDYNEILHPKLESNKKRWEWI